MNYQNHNTPNHFGHWCLVVGIYLGLSIWSLGFAPAARAAESALAASPALFEAVLTPGESTVQVIQIENTTNFPLPIKAQPAPFLAAEPIPPELGDTFDASAWFSLDPADFILQPHQSRPIQLTITPPEDIEPGGHYATVFFTPLLPEGVVSDTTTVSLARVGVLAFLVAPGDLNESLELTSFSAPQFLSHGPVPFTVQLHNPGSIHLIPQVEVKLTDLWGREAASLAAPLITILPGTDRTLELSWDRRLPFGRYSATATLIYGTSHPPVTATLQFWVLPWQLFLLLSVFLTTCYQLFIVRAKRIRLAWRVLRGQELINESTKNPKHKTKNSPPSRRGSRRPPRRPHSR